MRLLTQLDSIPVCYTIVCFFDKDSLRQIREFAEKLKTIDNQQYFIPSSGLHLTLFGEMDINSNKEQIIKIVQDFLNENRIEFRLRGVGSHKEPHAIIAYPIGFQLSDLRNKLRNIAGGKKLNAVYNRLAWINFMRFAEKPEGELLRALWGERETEIGMVRPKSIQLLITSSKSLRKVKVIHHFKIMN